MFKELLGQLIAGDESVRPEVVSALEADTGKPASGQESLVGDYVPGDNPWSVVSAAHLRGDLSSEEYRSLFEAARADGGGEEPSDGS